MSELSDRGTDQVEVEARSAISSLQIDLGKMSQRSIRDAAYLAPLTAIAAGHSLHVGVSAESNLKDQLTCLPSELGPWDFTTTLYRIEGGRFDVQQYHRDVDVKVVDIDAFELADFPVTNSMFELFVPSHRRQRDQYSHRDNDPVVHVSWYMATEFCFWLSALMGRQYRLPTEWEWEWATRWLDTRKEDYWWGPELDGELCWCSESLSRRGTRSRHQAIEAHQRVRHWHPSGSSADNPGLLDLSGNVWEWCENRGDLMALWRVLRGGCWFSIGWRCRSGYRLAGAPSLRNGYNGFRLAAVLEPSQASKQSVSAARGNVGSEGR
jgi:formylglycine-generating enzyme required for sulfatase activity